MQIVLEAGKVIITFNKIIQCIRTVHNKEQKKKKYKPQSLSFIFDNDWVKMILFHKPTSSTFLLKKEILNYILFLTTIQL